MSSVRKTAAPSKTATVQKMLRRAGGATLAEITTVTAWQPHSARAYLSGLRKKGEVLIKEARRSGEIAYRMGSPTSGPATHKGRGTPVQPASEALATDDTAA